MYITRYCYGLAFICVSLTVHADWQLPRTEWGAPDFQGVWSNETLTPFERSAAYADREFFTEEEAQTLAANKAKAIEADAASIVPDDEAPPEGGNVGAYNLGWLDNGSAVASTGRTSQVIIPKSGLVPVRADAVAQRDAAAARAYDDPEFMSVWDRCITRGIPGSMFPAGYNNYYKIVQQPDAILIYYEMIHEARVIPLNDRPRLAVESWNGQPRGRWEGDTLVVETAGFNNKGWIANSFSQGRIKGIQSTPDLKVVETFNRIDSDTIIWQVTISDPTVYESDWTVEIPMESRGDAKIFEYACHEGNQAVSNILRGARVQAELASTD